MHNRLTLLAPGLLQPPQPLSCLPAGEQPAFPLLNLFFSRAKQTQLPVKGFYPTLFDLFGVETGQQASLPVASLTRLVDAGEQDMAWCLRCDPAYIHADMDRAVLMGYGALGLTEEETEQLLIILNAHVAQDGWQIEALAVDRWYVRGTDKIQLSTTPPHEILGQDIKNALPKGKDAGYWRAMMNECQMLLHEQPLNLQRQARGLLPINSLWFWGEGTLPAKTECRYARVFCDDVLTEGLAVLSGCALGLPDELWSSIEQQEHAHYLLVLDELISPQVNDDLFAWVDAVSRIEQNTIHNIINMLKTRQLGEVTLLSADGKAFKLTPGRLRRWWQRQAKFLSLLEKAVA